MSDQKPNGNTGVSPFGPHVPIIGQPATLKAWFLQVLVTCNCSPRPEPVLIIGHVGAVSAPCALCGRRFILQGVGVGGPGELQLNLGIAPPTRNEA